MTRVVAEDREAREGLPWLVLVLVSRTEAIGGGPVYRVESRHARLTDAQNAITEAAAPVPPVGGPVP